MNDYIIEASHPLESISPDEYLYNNDTTSDSNNNISHTVITDSEYDNDHQTESTNDLIDALVEATKSEVLKSDHIKRMTQSVTTSTSKRRLRKRI